MIDYAEIKDDLNVQPGHLLQLVGDAREYRVDHVSQDGARLRCTERRGAGRFKAPVAVITVDLMRGIMRRAGTTEDVPLQLLAVL